MKRIIPYLMVFLMAIGLILCGTAEAKPIKLRVGHDLPPFTTPGMGIDTWAKEVNKRTEGRVVVEVYPSSTLSEQKSGVEMLKAGVADGYMLSFGVHRQLFPVSSVTNLHGLGFPDTVEGHLTHANAFLALIDKYPVLAKELKDFKIIFDIINSNSILLSAKKEVRVPADLKGMKVGTGGRGLEFVKRLGCAGVFCVPPQAYQKLQTGVIDATPIHFLAIGEFKIYEVAKYALDLSWGQAEIPLVMNMNSWNKLSDRDQKIIMEAAVIGQRVAFEAAAERTIKGRKAFQDAGGKITIPTPEETALWQNEFSKVWEDWVRENEATGVKNARDILNDWKSASINSWGK